MLHLLVFCVGALAGGTFAWICNARIAERDEEAAAKRDRLTQIHLQGLHEAIRDLVAADKEQGVSPAEKALLRELRARYAAQAEEGKMCKS